MLKLYFKYVKVFKYINNNKLHCVDFMENKKDKNYFGMQDSRMALTLHGRRNRLKDCRVKGSSR